MTPNNADGSNPGTIYYTAGNAGAILGQLLLGQLLLHMLFSGVNVAMTPAK